MLSKAEAAAHRFNNARLFNTFRSHNEEYEHPIIYKPIRQYCQERFIRPINTIGIERVSEIFANVLPGTRVNVSFTHETRVLAFLTGLRESGLPLIFANRNTVRSGRGFISNGRRLYLRNYDESGLDNMGSHNLQRRVARFLIPVPRDQIFFDDPTSTNIGIRQQYLHAIFAAYFRDQEKFNFPAELPFINDRLIRYFWRSLTFQFQGGSKWMYSRAGGRTTLITLFTLLSLSPERVPDLWDGKFGKARIDNISDIGLLRQLARKQRSTRHSNDVSYWQSEAKRGVARGIASHRYDLAMKIAAIAEAFSELLSKNFYI